jgi:hypothetical protein
MAIEEDMMSEQAHAEPSGQAILRDLEDIWSKFDQVWAGFTPGRWTQKYGKDWVFADQPYHLMTFNRLAADSLSQGAAVPEGSRLHLRSMRDINEWNAQQFALRPGSQSVEQTLEQLRASRQALRDAVAGKSQADLQQPAWVPLLIGWARALDLLALCLVHDVGEYTELRLRSGGGAPPPSPSATHARLGFMMQFMKMAADARAAGDKPFTAVWDFTGPGGGAWTFRVANGECVLSEGRAQDADIVLTTGLEGFERILRNMGNPMLMMLTGDLKVKGISNMGRFSRVFAEPAEDKELAPA